jgi:hypothetical protein
VPSPGYASSLALCRGAPATVEIRAFREKNKVVRWVLIIPKPNSKSTLFPLRWCVVREFDFLLSYVSPHPPRNGHTYLDFPVSMGRMFVLSSIFCRRCAQNVSTRAPCWDYCTL